MEAFQRVEQISGRRMEYTYTDTAREDDHTCYISNLAKARSHYPEWDISKSLDDIFQEIHQGWLTRAD